MDAGPELLLAEVGGSQNAMELLARTDFLFVFKQYLKVFLL
jgi:hypothetical protein